MEEQRVIFEEVSDRDKDLATLAWVAGDCLYRRNLGLCSDGRCASCQKMAKYAACYKALAVCDQLKVEAEARRLYQRRYAEHMDCRRRRRKSNVGAAFALALLFFLFFGCIALANAEPVRMRAYKNDAPIVETLAATRRSVRDCTGDGVVNCQDWALTFKREWDKRYAPEDCELVRNDNRATGFHHLFVVCRWTNVPGKRGDWVRVEPQGRPGRYAMSDYWGERYAGWWNQWGETDVWMSKYRE